MSLRMTRLSSTYLIIVGETQFSLSRD